jgi:hypothetical protein
MIVPSLLILNVKILIHITAFLSQNDYQDKG